MGRVPLSLPNQAYRLNRALRALPALHHLVQAAIQVAMLVIKVVRQEDMVMAMWWITADRAGALLEVHHRLRLEHGQALVVLRVQAHQAHQAHLPPVAALGLALDQVVHQLPAGL